MADIDQDIGLLIERPTKDLFQQITTLNIRSSSNTPSSLIMKPYYRLTSNIQYFSQDSHTPLTALPKTGYCWTIVSHPMTQQLTLGRVYTCDQATSKIYVQHYKVVVEPIESYHLKSTRHNLNSKGAKKYSSTTDSSAIIQCQGCHLHSAQQLVTANQRAYRYNRSPPSCIFKQLESSASLLPVKPHQPYKDITLLKHTLTDLLPHYEATTNLSPLQDHFISGTTPTCEELNRPRCRSYSSNSHSYSNLYIDTADKLIDLLIEAPGLTHKLKAIASSLSHESDVHIYTDGSLQKNLTHLALMGLG